MLQVLVNMQVRRIEAGFNLVSIKNLASHGIQDVALNAVLKIQKY
jgi:hypothetical protein